MARRTRLKDTSLSTGMRGIALVLASVLLTAMLPGGALAAVPGTPRVVESETHPDIGGHMRTLSVREMGNTFGKSGDGGSGREDPVGGAATFCPINTIGDPVLMTTASQVEYMPVFSIPGPAGMDMVLGYNYSSGDLEQNRRGLGGWYTPYLDSRFVVPEAGVYEQRGFDGSRQRIVQDGSGNWVFENPMYSAWDATNIYNLPNGETWWDHVNTYSGITYRWKVEDLPTGGAAWFLRQTLDRHGNSIDLITGDVPENDGTGAEWRTHVRFDDAVGRSVRLNWQLTPAAEYLQFILPDGETIQLSGETTSITRLVDQEGVTRYLYTDYLMDGQILGNKYFGDPTDPVNYLGYSTRSYDPDYHVCDRPAGTEVFDENGNLIESYGLDNWAQPVRATVKDAAGVVKFRKQITFDETYRVGSLYEYLDANDNVVSSKLIDWDADGKITQITNTGSGTTTFSYDGDGNRTGVTSPLGCQSTALWSTTTDGLLRRMAASTDPLGRTSTATFDPVTGDYTRVINGLGRTMDVTYNPNGTVSSITNYIGNPAGNTVYVEYDRYANVDRITVPNGTVTALVNDIMGRPMTITAPAGAAQETVTTLTYDGRGYVTSITGCTGTVSMTRDTWGNALTVTDPQGLVTTIDYRIAFQQPTLSAPKLVTLPDGATISATYDGPGNLLSLTDEEGQTTSFTYASACGCGPDDRLATISYPDGSTESVTYDLAGNITSYTDREGQTSTYTYDLAGNILTATLPGTEGTTTFTYDCVGRPLTASDADSTITWTYDPVTQQPETETTIVNGGAPRTITYSYDADGRVTGVTHPSGLQKTFTYDTLGRLASLTTPLTSHTITYDAEGRAETVSAGNGVTTTYGYGASGQAASISHRGPLNEDLLTVDYTFDSTCGGNIDTRTESGFCPAAQEQFERDTRGQLKRVTRGGVVEEDYTYDPSGNRMSDVNGTAYAYEAQTHRMTQMGAATYTYNGRGHQTREDRGGGDYTDFAWSAAGQLAQVTDALTGDTVVYRYDPLGRRVGAEVTSGGVTTVKEWVYDGQDLVEYHKDGALEHEYVHGPGIDRPWAYIEHNGVTTPHYYHTDHLGSVRAITNASGGMDQAYKYDAFGETEECIFPFPFQPFQYAARENDEDSGLYYYRARYYNPQAGRFISPDPLGAAGGRTNRFLYVGNSPTRFKDPTGASYVHIQCTEMFSAALWPMLPQLDTYILSDGMGGRNGPAAFTIDMRSLLLWGIPQTDLVLTQFNSFYFGSPDLHLERPPWTRDLLVTYLHEQFHAGEIRSGANLLLLGRLNEWLAEEFAQKLVPNSVSVAYNNFLRDCATAGANGTAVVRPIGGGRCVIDFEAI